MMYKKTFEYKGQMINYLNKVRNNDKIKCVYSSYSVADHCWVIKYMYK